MSSKRNIIFFGIAIFLFIFIISLVALDAADTPSQVVTHIDEILKNNPLKAGEKVQMIKIAQDDTVSFFAVRASEGVELKPHFHKTHDEIVYVIAERQIKKAGPNDPAWNALEGTPGMNRLTRFQASADRIPSCPGS